MRSWLLTVNGSYPCQGVRKEVSAGCLYCLTGSKRHITFDVFLSLSLSLSHSLCVIIYLATEESSARLESMHER